MLSRKKLRDAGLRCILYTDLGNPHIKLYLPTIGYRAVAETLRHRLD